MKTVTVTDSTQPGYTYELRAPMGQQYDPDFKPELTPSEMLRLGVFDGAYFPSTPEEFPPEWFSNASPSNFFGISASQPLSVWQANGWIYPEDPYGWFQWYCRYYMGRRLPLEDKRQIKRWKAMTRHIAQVKHACKQGDCTCRQRQRQALLHWAYDSRNL